MRSTLGALGAGDPVFPRLPGLCDLVNGVVLVRSVVSSAGTGHHAWLGTRDLFRRNANDGDNGSHGHNATYGPPDGAENRQRRRGYEHCKLTGQVELVDGVGGVDVVIFDAAFYGIDGEEPSKAGDVLACAPLDRCDRSCVLVELLVLSEPSGVRVTAAQRGRKLTQLYPRKTSSGVLLSAELRWPRPERRRRGSAWQYVDR